MKLRRLYRTDLHYEMTGKIQYRFVFFMENGIFGRIRTLFMCSDITILCKRIVEEKVCEFKK